MVTKNVQSIRSDARLEDLVLELKELDFDFLFLTETWRDNAEEMLEVDGGTKMFLSGGGPHQGVGIVVSKRCWGSMQDVVFHAYSPRVCSLTFRLANKEFVACACYMPTSWDTDEAVMEVYELLDLILYSRDCVNRLLLLGGDLNACIGQMLPQDDLASWGTCGWGTRNSRGSLLMEWVLEHGLQIFSRMKHSDCDHDSWTCQRASDKSLVQLDFLIGAMAFETQDTWNDFALPIGLDHRCVHCILHLPVQRPRHKSDRRRGLKHWVPYLDREGKPGLFQSLLRQRMSTCSHHSLENLELALMEAGFQGGSCSKTCFKSEPSATLRELRQHRRQATNSQTRRLLSFQIRRQQRRELRTWKSMKLREHLQDSSMWNALRKMDYHTVKTFVQEPHPNEFAKMLEELFSGIVTEPVKPDIFTEQMFELKELKTAIRRAKLAKAADETGLTAELLRHMPDDICNHLLLMFNHMLFSGEVPAAWRKTLFKMLPKTLKPRTTTDFRPIANIRLFYKIFAYMILGRIEDTLETSQPEEQHGFRSKKRIEEHLLTFNVILDKTLEMDQPLWLISLDLSKAFDRVNWESLWQAVGDHGVSQHLVWILQVLYYQQRGTIVGSMENSFEFDIAAGVRQGCVLSPRLFCSVLEWALSKWRAQLNGVGYNFQYGGVSLLDLRFADDILIFAKFYEEIGHVLDVLVDALRQVGLVLNAGKTKILTTQSQHPAELVSPGGIVVEILERDRAHKWLGCMISSHTDGSHGLDLEHHLQAAMVNGQCLYATRRAHFGHRRWKEICTLVSHAIANFSHIWQKV